MDWLKEHLDQMDGRLVRIEDQVNRLVETKSIMIGQARGAALVVSLLISGLTLAASFFF